MEVEGRFEKELVEAHHTSFRNRPDIERSERCGCFYCGAVFGRDEIAEWVEDDGDDTALCPYCGIDSVIGDAAGFPLTPEMLSAMNARWFGMALGSQRPRNEMVAQFVRKWCPRFRWWAYNMLFKTMEFPNDCRALGFAMDGGEAFEGTFPGCFRDPDATEAAMASCEDVDLLGSALHSGWRYYNRRNDFGSFEPEERAWFGVMLGRLGDLST